MNSAKASMKESASFEKIQALNAIDFRNNQVFWAIFTREVLFQKWRVPSCGVTKFALRDLLPEQRLSLATRGSVLTEDPSLSFHSMAFPRLAPSMHGSLHMVANDEC